MRISITKKTSNWEESIKRANSIVDGVGFPVDKKIKGLLVGLWAFNIKTASSCGGHIDRIVFPYILIGENPSKEELSVLPHPIPVSEIFEKFPKFNEVKKNNLRIQLKLLNLLSEYYRDYSVLDEEHRLILMPQGIYGPHKLINQGALIQSVLSNKQKKEKIKKYQQEMSSFAKFLKEKYFNKN